MGNVRGKMMNERTNELIIHAVFFNILLAAYVALVLYDFICCQPKYFLFRNRLAQILRGDIGFKCVKVLYLIPGGGGAEKLF